MPKVTWKAFLQGKRKLKPGAERNMLYEIRKRAQENMQELTDIISGIRNVSKHPEREYARIFKDEKVYHEMRAVLYQAYFESYRSTLKLYLPENLDAITIACARAGIPLQSKKQLADRHIREKVLNRLKQEKRDDGMSWSAWMQEYLLEKRFDGYKF